MRIIRPNTFVKIEDVRLNKGGKVIGQIVRLDTDYYYLSHRTENHFFIRYRGFGCDATLFKKLIDIKFQTELQERLGIKKFIKGIIIEYQGKKEHRFYFADLDTWLLRSTPYGTAKLTDDSGICSYGRQLILPLKEMSLFGISTDDYTFFENGRLNKFIR